MKKIVSIIGGGTAGLFLAAFLDPKLFDISIYEKKSSFGRKFLVAGDGGLNLSHAENMDDFKLRYTPETFLTKSLDQFNNEDMRKWLLSIGIPTFVGSSKRVFPEKGIKPITVLENIKSHLSNNKIGFEFNKEFTGWGENNSLIFNSDETIKSDYTIFALGGASWKITGSDGKWLNIFSEKGIKTIPFKAANCAFEVGWSDEFITKHKGTPLKNISCFFQDQHQKGEAVITEFGIEGNAIYALSPKIQAELASKNEVLVEVDFKPSMTFDILLKKLLSSNQNTSQAMRNIFKLSAAQVSLIKKHLTKEAFLDASTLIKTIKRFPLKIIGSAPIDEAISTSGGIDINAVDENFELIKLKNNFTIGEMVDWNAPTGGYLIQACASMGVSLARTLNSRYF